MKKENKEDAEGLINAKTTYKLLIILGIIIIIIHVILLTQEQKTSDVFGLIAGTSFLILGIYMKKHTEKNKQKNKI